jgi:hypothetical protein
MLTRCLQVVLYERAFTQPLSFKAHEQIVTHLACLKVKMVALVMAVTADVK